MAQNETISLALEAQPVPPDRECVRNLSDILKGAQDYLQVIGDGSSQPGQLFPSAVVIAKQALALAEEALAEAQAVDARVPERRTSSGLITVPTGDSTLPLSWSPAMPSNNYEVRVVFYGSVANSGAAFSYRVIDGSQTVDGVQVKLLNLTADTTKISWVVEALTT